MGALRIERESLDSVVANSLIEALNADIEARYPEPESYHWDLDPDEVAPGRGAFLVAWLDDVAVGCGAVRLLAPAEAELKRMYVAPEARGRGIGGALVRALEGEARALSVKRLLLETGERQIEALAVYTREGFIRIPKYGEYVDSEFSVCMGKDLG
jgi:putative acetyltransferase